MTLTSRQAADYVRGRATHLPDRRREPDRSRLNPYLHYYDEIGLLVPRARNDSGYRLYTNDDLLRLQQILIGRELGSQLEDIRRSLDDPSFDRRAALLEQRRQLQQRAADTASIDHYGTGLTTFLAAAIRANADRESQSRGK